MDWGYLFKHWFVTLLLGPIIAEIIECYVNAGSYVISGYLEVYPLFLIFGLVCSTPTYILYAFLYFLLAKKNINLKYAKAILILFSVFGVMITFLLIGGSLTYNGIWAYSLASIISGLFFKLKFKES